LRNVFGCEEFGLVTGALVSKKLDQWNEIKDSLDKTIGHIDKTTGPERALLDKLKEAFLGAGSEQPISPKSP